MSKSLTEQPYINKFDDLRNAESNALLELCRKLEYQNADLSKKVERFQEQLNESNEVILGLHKPYETSLEPASIYLDKWGVK